MIKLLHTRILNDHVNALRKAGVKVIENDGHVVATDGDVVVLKAIQQGYQGAWITIYKDSDKIKWLE